MCIRDRLKNGDSAALLALSDKVQNCRWAMIELQSKELDCTTNLRQIYDRLPYPLQAKGECLQLGHSLEVTTKIDRFRRIDDCIV